MTHRCDWERRQRVVVDGRTVAEIRTACPHPGGSEAWLRGRGWICTACGQDVRRVPIVRDAQPARIGGEDET